MSLTDGLSVAELAALLEACPGRAQVRVTGPVTIFIPANVRLDSYRGYYEDIAMGTMVEFSSVYFSPGDRIPAREGPPPEPITAKELAAKLRALVGTEVQGYKGGNYRVHGGTPVWVSNYGEASGARVVALRCRRPTADESVNAWLELRMEGR